MTQRMKALKAFQMGDKTIAAGKVFKVRPRDVGALSAAGNAEIVDAATFAKTKAKAAAQRAQASSRAPARKAAGAKAQTAAKKPAAGKRVSALSTRDLKPTGKRQYNRRDMRAS